MNFSEALVEISKGNDVFRINWNGRDKGLDMYIRQQIPDEHSKMTQPYLYMVVHQLGCKPTQTPWTPSQLDLFATDWHIEAPDE